MYYIYTCKQNWILSLNNGLKTESYVGKNKTCLSWGAYESFNVAKGLTGVYVFDGWYWSFSENAGNIYPNLLNPILLFPGNLLHLVS